MTYNPSLDVRQEFERIAGLPRRHPDDFVRGAQEHAKSIAYRIDCMQGADFTPPQNIADLRGMPFVTIDPYPESLHDDAIYAEKVANGWELHVAIPDVSHYFAAGSLLDVEAYLRKSSKMIDGKMHHIFPGGRDEDSLLKKLSLEPDHNRRAMVFSFHIGKDNTITPTDIRQAIIRSKAAYSFTDARNTMRDFKSMQSFDNSLVQDTLIQLRDVGKAAAKNKEFFPDRHVLNVNEDAGDAGVIVAASNHLVNFLVGEILHEYNMPAPYRILKGRRRSQFNAQGRSSLVLSPDPSRLSPRHMTAQVKVSAPLRDASSGYSLRQLKWALNMTCDRTPVVHTSPKEAVSHFQTPERPHFTLN